MPEASNNNVYRVVRPFDGYDDGEVKIGNVVTARYTHASASSVMPTIRLWMATFASPGYIATGFAKESDALMKLSEQLRADAEEIARRAEVMAKEGR